MSGRIVIGCDTPDQAEVARAKHSKRRTPGKQRRTGMDKGR